MFSYAAYTFSFNRLTPVRYLSECSRDSRGGINISVIDTVRPRLLCALGKLCKLVPYIGLANGRGEERREEERERSVCVAAREHVRRACVRVRRAYVCARLRHVGSLFVPRAERPAVSAVSFYSRPFAPRPSGVTSPLTVLPPLAPPKLYASIASMRVSIDALRARRE